MTKGDTPIVELRAVERSYDGRRVLGPVDWTIEAGRHWALLGPNGSGKSTLMRIAGMHLHPSLGSVDVLGQRLGRTDVRRLRAHVGYSSAGLADQIRPQLTGIEIVMTAKFAALEPWWHTYDDADRDRSQALLDQVGCGHVAHSPFATMSSGERQRTLLGRALFNDPALVLLDEPAAGLDLGGREELLDTIDELIEAPGGPAVAMVTHHVEEIPSSMTDLMLLREGVVVAEGPIESTLTAVNLSRCFGQPVRLERIGSRHVAFRGER